MDREISKQEEKDWDSIRNDFRMFSRLPDERLTKNILKKLVEDKPLYWLEKYTDVQKTDDVILAALRGLCCYPGRGKTFKENILDAIKFRYSIFPYLPERLKDKEVCIRALEANACNIVGVPAKLVTEEICSHVGYVPYVGCENLDKIPYASAVLKLLKENPDRVFELMRYFNPLAISSKVASEAVRQDIRCFRYIPDGVEYASPVLTDQEKKDIIAVSSNIYSYNEEYRNLPLERQTENVSLAVVCTRGEYLQHIPKSRRTDKIIDMALKKDGGVISQLFPDEITDVRRILAVKNMQYGYPEPLKNCPKDLLDEDICVEAVSKCPIALMYVPDEFLTNRVCEAAVNNLVPFNEPQCMITSYLPVEILEKYLFHFAGEIPDVLDTIKRDNITPKVIEFAINNTEEAYLHIPREKLTAEHCLLQEKLYPNYFKESPAFLPDRIKNGDFNIYQLNEVVEAIVKDKFTFEQIKELYAGRRLDGKNVSFVYNPEQQSLSLFQEVRKMKIQSSQEAKPNHKCKLR